MAHCSMPLHFSRSIARRSGPKSLKRTLTQKSQSDRADWATVPMLPMVFSEWMAGSVECGDWVSTRIAEEVGKYLRNRSPGIVFSGSKP
ncbi:MAG: hypothetical protein ACD_75C00654G0001 [uncultured bacterium]|nr:MAG: hypothetical protein ACD_75C00654G0001 [uncultured bacterium]